MRIGKSYKQCRIEGSFDAIVIGSGIGGLTTAAVLSKHAGERVLVLERHYTAGGFTHAFYRPGYEWDVGVHYIGDVAPGRPTRAIFDDITDGALDWEDMGEVYDKIIVGDDEYDFVRGRRAWRKQMLEYFPGEEAAIDGYLERMRAVTQSAMPFFAEKVVPKALAAVGGGLMRRGFLKLARRKVYDVLRELTDNERLITVLTGQWGDYGMPPREASFAMQAFVASHYLHGAWYPVGGATRIAETIEPVIERGGGMVVTNADVEQILVEGGRAVGVRMADGRELRAPRIVSGAGLAVTVGRLLPDEVAMKRTIEKKMQAVPPSGSHLSLYVGLRHTAEELGLPRHNLWVYPGNDHDASVKAFVDDPDNAPLPVVFVSFPSAKDPDFQRRHPGNATIEVVTLAPYEWFSKWEQEHWKKRGPEYSAYKEQLTERLLEALYRHVPQVRGKVDHAELSTPLSTQRFAAHPHGEIYGLSHGPDRFDQRWLQPRTPVKGLFMTGADVLTAGVGGAMMSGVLTASVITGRNLLGTVTKGMRNATPTTAEAAPAPA